MTSTEPTLDAVTTDLVAQVVREQGHITLALHGLSMSPTLPPGARITVERCDPATLRPGQVVAFESAGRIVAHRIIRVHDGPAGRVFVTKGDRGYRADDAISADRVIGRVTEARDPVNSARIPLDEPTQARFWVWWGLVQAMLVRYTGWVPRRLRSFCRRRFNRISVWMNKRS
jgi:signal peptidase I